MSDVVCSLITVYMSGTRWVRTKHIWSDKRKSQLMADWTNSQQIRQPVQQMGQTVLKIGQNIAQSISLSILLGNVSNIADG